MVVDSWTAIVLTCSSHNEAVSYQRELEGRRKQGVIGEDVLLLTVEDAKTRTQRNAAGIGSGGATINALLVVTEYLSAKKGKKEIDYSILETSRIFIAHAGTSFLYDGLGRAFTPLPITTCVNTTTNESNIKDGNIPRHVNILCNLDLLLYQITEKLAAGSPPGVWICSTDMVLQVGKDVEKISWETLETYDAVAFSVPSGVEAALTHGVFVTEPDGEVTDILYREPPEKLTELAEHSGGFLDVVIGVVYFTVPLAQRILRLHTVSPVNMCTYLGLDSGSEPVEISLFFDILYAMTKAESRMFKRYSESPELKVCWNLLKNALRGSKLKLVSLKNGKFNWIYNQLEDLVRAWQSLDGIEHPFSFSKQTHSIVQTKAVNGLTVINSKLCPSVSLGKGCSVTNCWLEKKLTVGDNSWIAGIDLGYGDTVKSEIDLIEPKPLVVGKNTYIGAAHIKLEGGTSPTKVYIIHGCSDNVDVPFTSANATFCNEPWSKFFGRCKISQDELWPANMKMDTRSLRYAKLFPVLNMSGQPLLSDVLWMQPGEPVSDNDIYRWRSSWRLSLEDLQSMFHVAGEMASREKLSLSIGLSILRSVLLNNEERPLGPIYASIAATGSQSFLNQALQCLDDVAISCDSVGKAARVFANIADLLGAMAGNAGGLRSGPSANRHWKEPYKMLEMGNIKQGVVDMASVRASWLGRPDLLIRAARHYEGAAQILIRQAVSQCKQFITLKQKPMIPFGYWAVGESAARLDLSGAWSDTPPISYENGGTVAGVAITIDGKRPIGAKVRRLADPALRLVLYLSETERQELEVTTLQDLADYNKPEAPGALLKAAFCCTDIVDMTADLSLQDQLLFKFGGGFELHSWSNLPRGSGLGTSSILAGVICAVLWTASGKEYDNKALIHMVLIVEQMLTTGGGWQDQVGGLVGGIKLQYCSANLPMEVKYEQISVSPETIKDFNERLILVYTGKTRLAKNLLQNVVRCWYARDTSVIWTQEELVKGAKRCGQAFERGDIEAVGVECNYYWMLKKRMAAGCETPLMARMVSVMAPHTHGLCMCGAGGGGFVYLVMKEPDQMQLVEAIFDAIGSREEVSIHQVEVDSEGLVIDIVKDDE